MRMQRRLSYHVPKGIQKVVLQLIRFLICSLYLRKDYTVKERREILLNICTIFDVEGIDRAKLLSGLANEEFFDFEDCLQMECAKSYGAEYIVTRNVLDYSVSDIKAILPSEYLEL